MSTEQINQAPIEDSEMKELLQPEVKSEEDDDNKLVTREDLETRADSPIPTKSLWADSDRLAKLRAEIQVLTKVRIPVEQLPEEVILKAMAEVLSELGWSDYGSFNKTIRRILTGPPKAVPFAVKTRNQRTGLMDFWLIRVFVVVGDTNKEYEVDGKQYSKRDVLMSHQFCDYLRDFCRTELHALAFEIQARQVELRFPMPELGSLRPDRRRLGIVAIRRPQLVAGGGQSLVEQGIGFGGRRTLALVCHLVTELVDQQIRQMDHIRAENTGHTAPDQFCDGAVVLA